MASSNSGFKLTYDSLTAKQLKAKFSRLIKNQLDLGQISEKNAFLFVNNDFSSDEALSTQSMEETEEMRRSIPDEPNLRLLFYKNNATHRSLIKSTPLKMNTFYISNEEFHIDGFKYKLKEIPNPITEMHVFAFPLIELQVFNKQNEVAWPDDKPLTVTQTKLTATSSAMFAFLEILFGNWNIETETFHWKMGAEPYLSWPNMKIHCKNLILEGSPAEFLPYKRKIMSPDSFPLESVSIRGKPTALIDFHSELVLGITCKKPMIEAESYSFTVFREEEAVGFLEKMKEVDGAEIGEIPEAFSPTFPKCIVFPVLYDESSEINVFCTYDSRLRNVWNITIQTRPVGYAIIV